MNREELVKTVKAVKAVNEGENKRNFKQSLDLIINLKGVDIKKNPVDSYVQLPKGRGRKLKICALIDKELSTEAKNVFDEAILKDDFANWQGNNKKLRKLVRNTDAFVAQANIMPQIATVFGKVLGPKSKMPSPKSGAVVPPNPTVLKGVYERLQNSVRINCKNEAVVKCPVGMEDSKDEDVADNILAVYNNLVHILPHEEADVKSVIIKLTMGKPFKVGTRK